MDGSSRILLALVRAKVVVSLAFAQIFNGTGSFFEVGGSDGHEFFNLVESLFRGFLSDLFAFEMVQLIHLAGNLSCANLRGHGGYLKCCFNFFGRRDELSHIHLQ